MIRNGNGNGLGVGLRTWTPIRIGQAAPATPPAPAPAPAPAPVSPGYSGLGKFIETVGILGVTASSAWVGMRTALAPQRNSWVKAAGWVGGLGSGFVGLFYLLNTVGIPSGLPRVEVNR